MDPGPQGDSAAPLRATRPDLGVFPQKGPFRSQEAAPPTGRWEPLQVPVETHCAIALVRRVMWSFLSEDSRALETRAADCGACLGMS